MQLSRRERIAVIIAVASVGLFLVLQFLLFPLIDSRARLAKGLLVREKALVEMRAMQAQYRSLSEQNRTISQVLEQREAGFSLFSFLEQNAADGAVKEHIAYMKPSERAGSDLFRQSQVEMKLQAISLKQLVHFLERIESPEHLVSVDKIIIQENGKEKTTLDVTLQLVSIDQAIGAEQ